MEPDAVWRGVSCNHRSPHSGPPNSAVARTSGISKAGRFVGRCPRQTSGLKRLQQMLHTVEYRGRLGQPVLVIDEELNAWQESPGARASYQTPCAHAPPQRQPLDGSDPRNGTSGLGPFDLVSRSPKIGRAVHQGSIQSNRTAATF